MTEELMNVLVVDDDEVDRQAASRAFSRFDITDRLFLAEGSNEAMAMLRGDRKGPPLERPLLILLDLKMPGIGGLEFLQQLRSEPELNALPVIVTTVSSNEEDIQKAYQLGIDGYLVKPINFEKFAGSLVGGKMPETDTGDEKVNG